MFSFTTEHCISTVGGLTSIGVVANVIEVNDKNKTMLIIKFLDFIFLILMGNCNNCVFHNK